MRFSWIETTHSARRFHEVLAKAKFAQQIGRLAVFSSLRGAKRTKQSILSLCGEMDCFAPLAMTAEGGLT
jgi:hypothetical protein